jgi:hypothetical protein
MTHQMIRRLACIGAVAAVAAIPTAAGATAPGVPGAVYRGTASDGATITFTVSSDGTIVDEYSIDGVKGSQTGGGTCDFTAAGAVNVWIGAPVDGGAFSYTLGTAIVFTGSFTGTHAAAGTFRLYDAAVGSSPACGTGNVSWTASTASPPPGASKTSLRAVLTQVLLRTSGKTKVTGSLKTASAACRARRQVELLAGSKRMATVRANAKGVFTFTLPKGLSRTLIRAAVPAGHAKAVRCAPASSRFLDV